MNIPNYARAVPLTKQSATHLRSARCSRVKDVGLVWDLVLEVEVMPEQQSSVQLPGPLGSLRPDMLAAFTGGGGVTYKRNLGVEGRVSFAWLEDDNLVKWQREPSAATVRWVALKVSEKRALVQQCVRVVGRLGEHVEDLLDSTIVVGFMPAQAELSLAPKAAETLPPEPEETEDEDSDDVVDLDEDVVPLDPPARRRGRKS